MNDLQISTNVRLHREALPLALGIIGAHLGLRELTACPPGVGEDILLLRQDEISIVVRARTREKYVSAYSNQFTLREKSYRGARSEVEAIRLRDFCDYYLYGFVDDRRVVMEPWFLICVKPFYERPGLLNRFVCRRPSPGALFRAYRADSFSSAEVVAADPPVNFRRRFF